MGLNWADEVSQREQAKAQREADERAAIAERKRIERSEYDAVSALLRDYVFPELKALEQALLGARKHAMAELINGLHKTDSYEYVERVDLQIQSRGYTATPPTQTGFSRTRPTGSGSTGFLISFAKSSGDHVALQSFDARGNAVGEKLIVKREELTEALMDERLRDFLNLIYAADAPRPPGS